MSNNEPERLTHTEKEQLETELAELEGPRRTAVVEAIATARGFGDLSENFEYHAAKNEQGLLERRITLLRDRLSRALLVEHTGGTDAVRIGSQVELEDERGERLQLRISSVGGVSPESPAGRALFGKKAGDKVKIDAPSGVWQARILSIGA